MTEFAPYTYPSAPFVPYSTAKPLRIPALVATVGLGFVIVATIVVLLLSGYGYSAARDAISSGEGLDEAQAAAVWGLGAAAVLSVLSMIFAGIAFICWLHRARTNLDAFGGSYLKWGRGWTIGAWFVPLANLVIPILVVSEIDRATGDHVPAGVARRPGRIVVILWAVLWTAFIVLDRVTTFSSFDAAEPVGDIALLAMAALVEIGAAVCAILVVRRITAGQDALMSGAAAGPFPAGPLPANPAQQGAVPQVYQPNTAAAEQPVRPAAPVDPWAASGGA